MRFPILTNEIFDVQTSVGQRAKTRGYDLRAWFYIKNQGDSDDQFRFVVRLSNDDVFTIEASSSNREGFAVGLNFSGTRPQNMRIPPTQPGSPANPFVQRYAADETNDFSDLTVRINRRSHDLHDLATAATVNELFLQQLSL